MLDLFEPVDGDDKETTNLEWKDFVIHATPVTYFQSVKVHEANVQD